MDRFVRNLSILKTAREKLMWGYVIVVSLVVYLGLSPRKNIAILDQSACMSLTIEAALTQSLEPGLELPMITSSFLWNHWIIQPRDFITKPRRLSTVFLSSLADVVSPNSKTVYSPRLIKLFSSLLTFD